MVSGLSLESVLLEYGASEVSAMEVYSDIFQLGDGFIQTEGEPGGLHKANPIILGSFGGHYDSDGKLVGDRRRRRILFEDTFEETLAEFRDANRGDEAPRRCANGSAPTIAAVLHLHGSHPAP